MRYAGSDQPENIRDYRRSRCNLQNEWIDGWQSDFYRAKIIITIEKRGVDETKEEGFAGNGKQDEKRR